MWFTDTPTDITQTNILVDHLGRARIIDFALAAVTENKSPTCGPIDTSNHSTQWTAPEVSKGGWLTGKADVFSFAMVMIEVSLGVWYIVTST